MAYTSTDLANVEEAIRLIMSGSRIVNLTFGDKSVSYTSADLESLRKLRSEISMEIAISAGTYSPRTYARQGGRT